MIVANAEQPEFWSQLASAWIELEDLLEEISSRPGQLAMDRLGLRSGERVVDLGCGTGVTTVDLASRVAPGGQVVGVDIASGMLARARARAATSGVANVEFLHADLQVHDLGSARFDAAYSRFGVMFFADPTAAFANIRISLREGAALSFVAWQSVFENEWMLLPGAAVTEVTGSAPPMAGPGEPGRFSLAEPDRVSAILDAAGFTSIVITPHADQAVFGEDQIPEVASASMRVGGVRAMLQDADDATRQRAREAIEEALRSRLDDGQVRLSVGVWLVSARA